MKTVVVQHDKETDTHFLKLDDFKEYVDVAKVKSYSLEPVEDCDGENETKALILKFYDSDGKIIEAIRRTK